MKVKKKVWASHSSMIKIQICVFCEEYKLYLWANGSRGVFINDDEDVVDE